MFDVIERLKSEWTDKYVVVNASTPELARFAQATGFVKTVNMNGRCLVEFDQYNNVGWYDIDPTFLRVVPKPQPKPPEAAAKTAAAKPVAKEAAKPAAKQPAKPAAKPSAAGVKRPSTAEILAAARAKKGGAAPAAPPPAEEQAAEEEPAAEAAVEESKPVKAAPKPAAKGPGPQTTAEKIAWCRANDAGKG